MLERIKTMTLILLVATSFYLTYNLWWDNRSFEPLVTSEYAEPLKIGAQRSWGELIQPEGIVFHYNNNSHTKATPEMSVYNMLWDAMQRWQFIDPKEIRINLERGREILEEHNGLEIIFADEYPVQFFADVIELPEGMPDMLESFNRIWVYELEPSLEYKVLFISDDKRRVIETELIDLDRAKGFGVRNLIILGSHLTAQQPAQYATKPIGAFGINIDFFDLIYLPVERSDMNQWKYTLSPVHIEEMANALFLDISAMREIAERGGSQIFTDGTKSLQYKGATYDMRFFLPVYEQGLTIERTAGFYPVLDFMNHHYGWTGEYRVESWRNDQELQGIAFREYIAGYPIYSEQGTGFGEIQLTYQFNQVNEYTRNLLRLESSHSGYQIKIKSGAELLEQLRLKKVYLYNIKQIELGYKAVLNLEKLEAELIPHYIIHYYSDRDPLLIDARVQSAEE